MKQAVIDIGSNSMRITLYNIENGEFQILFREKIMAGLASYVDKGALTRDGIDCACKSLEEFCKILSALDIGGAAVFATASLRNISNTAEAVDALKDATGLAVDVISGEEEALCGFEGAMLEFDAPDGAFADIGGASTEIVRFHDRVPLSFVSYPIGSLNLYKNCVKKILPGDGGMERISRTIEDELGSVRGLSGKAETLIFVGGTARAILKMAIRKFSLPEGCQRISAEQLEDVCRLLCRCDKEAIDFILKLTPDRVHTIVPGVMEMRYICERFGAKEIAVSKYGVREGYLCRKVLKDSEINMHTPKTVS